MAKRKKAQNPMDALMDHFSSEPKKPFRKDSAEKSKKDLEQHAKFNKFKTGEK